MKRDRINEFNFFMFEFISCDSHHILKKYFKHFHSLIETLRCSNRNVRSKMEAKVAITCNPLFPSIFTIVAIAKGVKFVPFIWFQEDQSGGVTDLLVSNVGRGLAQFPSRFPVGLSNVREIQHIHENARTPRVLRASLRS